MANDHNDNQLVEDEVPAVDHDHEEDVDETIENIEPKVGTIVGIKINEDGSSSFFVSEALPWEDEPKSAKRYYVSKEVAREMLINKDMSTEDLKAGDVVQFRAKDGFLVDEVNKL